MSYKALYRTYRPKTFDEVSGQQHIVKTLKNALATGKIAHAYLFAGPRGTGKTTMAKLFAKALNCEEGIGHECLECKNCKAILEGSHPDVIEIDAASNNGVDDVRELIENVRYATILGKYKVYIIDEVHSLSGNAYNALLKTLEEPPENVVFILATTEPHRIIPTILSRCQRYDFSKLSDGEIKDRLIEVLKQENIEYEEEALNIIISLSDGGMRDALSILDQILAYSSNKLLAENVLQIFSLESFEEKKSIIKAIVNNDVATLIKKSRGYISKGTDINRLTTDLLNIFKDILIYKDSASKELLVICNEESVKEFISINENILLECIDILDNALQNYRFVSSASALFEISILKLASLFKNKANTIKVEIKEEEIITEPLPTIEEIKVEETKIIKEKESEPLPIVEEEVNIDKSLIMPVIINQLENDEYSLTDETVLNIMITAKKEIKTEIAASWNRLKSFEGHPEYGKIASLLSDGHLLVASKECIVLEFDFSKQIGKVNNKESQRLIQQLTQIVFKKKLFTYALVRKDSIRFQNIFLNLRQIGKMPKPENIEMKWNEEK